jgi:KTSC domain
MPTYFFIRFEYVKMVTKNINSREIISVGYDEEKKECSIEYNHYGMFSQKTIVYENIDRTLFSHLLSSQSIARDAQALFVDKLFKIINHATTSSKV